MKQKNFNRIQPRLGGVSRRDFMKFCSGIAASMAVPAALVPDIAQAVTSPQRPPVIWLHGSECTGCSMSLLRSEHPSLEKLIFELISLDFHETVSAGAGHQAEAALHHAIEENYGKFILVIEGAIPLRDGGIYCQVGGKNFVDTVREIGPKAGAIIAVGSCASWGGVAAMDPNPTQCVGVQQVLGDSQVVSIPGCPPNPYNLLSTIIHFLTFNKMPALDGKNRPKFAYGRLIHEHCERRPHFDNGRFARQFGDEGHRQGYCLYYLGCKGPVTYANCSTSQFGDAGSGCWPVATGHPCFGCAQEGVGFHLPQFSTSPVLHATPAASHAPITVERGQGASPGSAALMAGLGGAALGAGAVFTAKLGSKGTDHEDEKA
ncbi:hydrogenase small subunit [Desulfogranum mediterraneum]|uniref:hydrogenase small subunit n=1 Tax=Desulfogranum mediterraneum TaxID=160661 RepID=UPI00048D7E61|nr:hydrogenase small subunit [Desulfogranum mediterraneum]